MAALGNGRVVGGGFCASQGDSWLGRGGGVEAEVCLVLRSSFLLV